SLKEVEDDLEAPTAALDAMCGELVGRAVADDRIMQRLAIPEPFWDFIATSWKRGDGSLYGRFDLRYDGEGPAKLLEYNADTPTSLVESAIVQWYWKEDVFGSDDQWNSLHEALVARWQQIVPRFAPGPVHFAWTNEDETGEEDMTTAYLQDTAEQAGARRRAIAMEDI